MVEDAGQPTITVEQHKLGGWYVMIAWPDGWQQQIGPCHIEAEAQAWIEQKSAQWLALNSRSLQGKAARRSF